MEQPGCDPVDYARRLEKAVRSPKGFRFFSDTVTFIPDERPGSDPLTMRVNGFISDGEETYAVGALTQNRFPGAPIRLARERLPAGQIRGCVVNNRVANVAAPGGYEDAVRLATAFADRFSLESETVLSVSTGVIGWRLPVAAMLESVATLPDHGCSPLGFAQGIMTTDRYPKIASKPIFDGKETDDAPILLGVAKGAGMVEPHLATMLAFFLTDAVIAPEKMKRIFDNVVANTFNSISVDSDQSTSDMVLLVANGASRREVSEEAFERALSATAERLVDGIVRNGEGTAHVIAVTVTGVGDTELAREIGKHIVNSPLVKTAVYGNDPNVGRILAATGDALDHLDPDGAINVERLRIKLFGREVYRDGAFRLDGELERALSQSFHDAAMVPTLRGCPQHEKVVDITLDFGFPGGGARVLGSDLSYEYVRENADYRS